MLHITNLIHCFKEINIMQILFSIHRANRELSDLKLNYLEFEKEC